MNAIRQQAAKEASHIERQANTQRRKDLKNNIKQLSNIAEQFGDVDVVRINTTQPIQQVQELGRVLQSKNRTTMEQIRTRGHSNSRL
jgi:hypothetical protein